VDQFSTNREMSSARTILVALKLNDGMQIYDVIILKGVSEEMNVKWVIYLNVSVNRALLIPCPSHNGGGGPGWPSRVFWVGG